MPRTPQKTHIRAFHFATASPQALAVVSPLTGTGEGANRLTEAKLLDFGKGNTLPQVWLDMVLQSGTAYTCLEKRKTFLEGAGLPPEIGKQPVPGSSLTLADFWSQLCSYGAGFRAVAALVRYTATGLIGEVHLLPTGSVRKTLAGTFLFNARFGREGYKQSEDTEHLPFDDSPEAIAKVLDAVRRKNKLTGKAYGQPGQILYAHIPQAGEEDYALPAGWVGREDIQTDTEYARFDLEEVRNGFFPNTIITLLGAQNNTTADENNETEEDRTDDEIRDFTGNGSHPLGRKKVLVLDAATKDLAPVVQTFDGGKNLEKLIAKRPAVAEAVCRHFGILPVLIGLSTAGKLGQSQEILNAVELTQDALTPLREMLLRMMRRLFPAVELKVSNKKPISFLPAEVYKTLTPDEVRALGGYAPSSAQNDTLEKLNSMAPGVAAAVMAKMSADQLLALVGLKVPAEPTAIPPSQP